MGSQVSDARLVLDALRKLVRGLRVSAGRAEKRLGVSGAQLFVLEQLKDGKARSLSQLAQATRTDPSSVSVVVQRLVEAQLVTRAQAAADARRAQIVVTASGRKVLARSPKTLQGDLFVALDGLSKADRRALARILTAVVNKLGLGDSAPLFFEGAARAR